MSIRLQVVVSENEFDSIRDVARVRGMTATEWVRETLGKACCHVAASDVDRKLAAIRDAERHHYPTADMDQMLSEIERDSCEEG